ncbi:MAG: hypothetical protein NT066_06055 [Candidatus Omnitrophica bacterium]|nr:hypothetical protein [Candidatus Omnitrophota bacterium]
MRRDIFKSAPRLNPKNIQKEDIPRQIGLYAWILRKTSKISYIGSAIGAGGLRRRICFQHLNPKYLEARKGKFTSRDSFQVNHPILIKGRVVICKSAFRRNIARTHCLMAGVECVEYIKRNFLLSFVIFGDNEKELVKEIEKSLILTIKPQYNIVHKK